LKNGVVRGGPGSAVTHRSPEAEVFCGYCLGSGGVFLGVSRVMLIPPPGPVARYLHAFFRFPLVAGEYRGRSQSFPVSFSWGPFSFPPRLSILGAQHRSIIFVILVGNFNILLVFAWRTDINRGPIVVAPRSLNPGSGHMTDRLNRTHYNPLRPELN
jgi:hypothetical protein